MVKFFSITASSSIIETLEEVKKVQFKTTKYQLKRTSINTHDQDTPLGSTSSINKKIKIKVSFIQSFPKNSMI